MTLSMPKKRRKGELPKNIRKGLIAKGEGSTWDDAAEIAGVSTYEMQQWRNHPDAESLIQFAMNMSLESSYSYIAKASPALAERLVSIGLDPKVKGYTAVSAIQTAFSILQSGVVDRENKQELKKLRELMERMEGEPSGIIDI